MSETVGYVGKLTLHKKYKDADELQANLQNFWQSIPREERDKYYKDVEEIDEYELEDNGYIVIDGNCIYKVELEDFDAYDDFVEITQVQDGVYENTDSLLRMKFNSADVYGQLQNGKTYTCDTYGWRVPFFSIYPNIVKCEEKRNWSSIY